MRTDLLMYFVITILCWGTWPIIKRFGNDGSPLSMFIVSLSALIPLLTSTFSGQRISLTSFQWMIFVLAGIAMGTGAKFFNNILASTFPISLSVSLVNGSTTVVGVLCGIIFFGDSLTFTQIIGVASIILGIILIGL
ncbi:EamA family transporter [Candidatus Falkowbacteria bacterium]|nr:EamA family transporter [Candidatus Falkowbacteria bacterium]